MIAYCIAMMDRTQVMERVVCDGLVAKTEFLAFLLCRGKGNFWKD